MRKIVGRDRSTQVVDAFADLGGDLRLALRGLRRNPGFAAAAVLTLALGIGATAAIYSVVEPVLFEPLPYPDPERVVMVWERDLDGQTSNVGFATFADLARDNHSFAAATALSYWTPTLTGAGEPSRLTGQHVSAAFFDVLGVKPVLGRGFLEAEDQRGADPVVVLSHGLWRGRFGGDPDVVGRTILLNGQATTVIGVMPAGFEDLLTPGAELWTPLRYEASLPWACRTCRHLRVAARLRPEVTVAAAEQEMNRLSENLVRAYPTEYAAPGMAVVDLRSQITRGVAMIVGQGLRLTALGAALGIGASIALSRFLEGLLYEVSPADPATYAGVSAVLVAVALVACWIPARRAARIDPVQALRAE